MSDGVPRVGRGNGRVSGLCQDLFPEMAGSSAFDGVQILVNPREVN